MSDTAVVDPVHEHVTGHDFMMLIGGDLVGAADGATQEAFDPSTGRPVARVPWAGAADVQRAYDAARRAQPAWQQLGVTGRSDVFARFAAGIAGQQERLAMLDAINGGMPYESMRFDVQLSLDNLRDWTTLVRWHGGRTIPATATNLHYTSYRPYGVVGKILAFNHPIMFAITRVLAALIAGNTVILKPAPQTPLSALALGEIARESFPPGVLNILSGGAEAGDAIVTHPQIKRIGFTGSAATGMKIQQRAATAAVKHLSLELGGKNPMIVFPDADFERAVEGAVMGMNFGLCSGQSCGSNSRTYVHRELYDAFVERVAERLDAMEVGPAYAPGTDMGPVVSADHYARVTGFIGSGREQGARLVAGGGRPAGVSDDGYFIRPTLFADVAPDMDIAHEEIFGPVMSFFPWENEDAVVAEANNVPLGLTAGVWTRDLTTAHRMAASLEAGYVWINDSSKHFWGTPFGGVKGSGLGREESIEEYESYLEQKSVHVILR